MSSKTLGTGFLSLTCGRGSAGLRNLVVGGRARAAWAVKSDKYSSRAYKLGGVQVSSNKTYSLGAWVEVLEGNPRGISAAPYQYKPAKWTHYKIAAYDMERRGRQWLTWELPAASNQGQSIADVLLIYAGAAGETQGVSIAISDVILIEGDVAPTGWIPAPEDVEADATATARVQTIMRHRDLVGIERDRLHEIYRKLRTDKRTPQDLGLRLEHLWISCNGAHAELDRACAAAIASPTDAANEAVNLLTGVYKTKVIDMQRGIQEAEAAIREAIFSEARGVSSARLDALALDPNKWYPITIELAATPSAARVERQFGLRLTRGLFSTKGTPQEWWGHKDGYHFSLHWSVQPAGWGQRREDRRVYAYIRHFLREGTPVVSSPKQITEGSVEYVYVRGGSLYELSVVGLSGLSIQIHPEGYEWRTSPGDDTYLRRLPVLESIASIGEPRMELDILSDRLLAEIARERGELQRAIQAAQSSSSAALEARVQGVLAQVSQLEGLMRDGQAVLQRQIDRQVERWYGSEIAQSGVPPTSLWPASDNAKHEGDTYTCVAPRGITINPANAAQYPNVGKSWRWTNGGSGTTYGWELIADTDITQALALASRAQATADGKMTHYITPTPPVAYQQGDQWTLPAPWQGRKGGKAHTYPEGTILTATADSLPGQHHPEHWVELVRYTDDSKIDALKVGTRNLVLSSGEPKTSNVYHLGSWQLSEPWQAGETYTYALWMRHDSDQAQRIDIYPNDGSSRLDQVMVSPSPHIQLITLTAVLPPDRIKPSRPRELRLYTMSNHPNRGGSVSCALEHIAVVRGNIPPQSWMPALEDIEAEIQARMREVQAQLADANRAISRAQGAADTAKRQADSAKSAAEANDGKIDEAEARGIAKTVSAYRQSLLTEWEALRSGYEALKTSEYLIDKQPLTTAYSTAKQRYDNLLAKITAILSDSKVSAQEYSQYTAAYAAYQPSAKTLADAIETAGKAIQAELLKRADDAAKGRVDSVKVGGRNYCRIADFPMVLHGGVARTRPFSEVLPAGEYMVSVKIRVLNDEVSHIAVLPTLDANHQGFEVQDTAVNGDGIYTIPVKPTKEWDRLYMYSNRRWQAVGTGGRVEISWVKVESGNRATDYTLAPEDLDEEAQRKADEAERRAKAEAERRASEAEQRAKAEARRAAEEAEHRAKEHAERQIAHMDYLKAVLRKGQASIQGGAILGQYIAVADLEQVVRGYISGMLNGVFLAAGVSNHGTPQETRNVEITHEGDGHFGQLHFSGSGQDGRIDFVRHGATAPYLSVGGVLAPIEEVILDALLKDTYTSPQIDMDYYPLPLSGASKQIKTFSVLRDGASCRISGQLGITSLRFNGSGAGENRRVAVTTEIILQRQSTNWVDVAVIGSTWVGGLSNQDYWQEPAKVVDLQLPNLPKGQYRLVAQSKYTDNYYSLQVISQIRIMPLTILVERVSSVQQVAFTERGFRAFYGAERHVDIAAQGPHVLSVRGDTNIPGVLAAGRVSAEGQVTTSWGAYCKRPGYQDARASVNSDGSYTVYHSIGHTDYVVQLTTEESWNSANYYDVRPNSFRVRLQNPTQSFSRYFPNPFSYVCIGNNKGQS